MIRYENLLLIIVLSGVLLLNPSPTSWHPRQIFRLTTPRRLGLVVLFGLCSSVYILSRFYGDFVYHGDMLYSIGVSKSHFMAMMQEGLARRGFILHHLYNAAFWPGVIIISYSPLIAILAFLGLFRSFWTRKLCYYALIPLAFWTAYTYQSVVSQTLSTFARYSVPLGLFLLPLAGAELAHLNKRLAVSRRRLVDGIIASTMILSFLFLALYGIEGYGTIRDKLSSVSPVSRLPAYIEEIITLIDREATQDDRVVVENDLVAFYLTLPKGNLLTRWSGVGELKSYIVDQRPRYMVYSPGDRLLALFPLRDDDSLQIIDGVEFTIRYRANRHRIYELSYVLSGREDDEQPSKDM